jgi:hypothetical protein
MAGGAMTEEAMTEEFEAKQREFERLVAEQQQRNSEEAKKAREAEKARQAELERLYNEVGDLLWGDKQWSAADIRRITRFCKAHGIDIKHCDKKQIEGRVRQWFNDQRFDLNLYGRRG